MALVGVHDWFDLRRVGGTGCGLWGWCGTSHRRWNGRRYASPITSPSRHQKQPITSPSRHQNIQSPCLVTDHITITPSKTTDHATKNIHHASHTSPLVKRPCVDSLDFIRSKMSSVPPNMDAVSYENALEREKARQQRCVSR